MIASFKDQYRFLSNFYPCKVVFEGKQYRSAEHAYVAAKTTDDEMRDRISQVVGAGEVKRMGRKLELRPDWNEKRLHFMRVILESKFSDDKLMTWLEATRPHELVEGNYWGDTFWGQCPLGNGHNHLGKILMEIRDDMTKLLKG